MMDTILITICLFFVVVRASVITFQSKPDSIKLDLTQSLRMRCSLNDTLTSTSLSGAVVGKRRDVTQTLSDITFVTSVVVMRNGSQHVASVTQVSPARATLDQSNIQVSGGITGKPGERAYIELVWDFPTADQLGEYVCEINGMNSEGHNVVFSKEANVIEASPTITDLVQQFHTLVLENRDQKSDIAGLKSENTAQASEISSLKSENTAQDSEISRLKSKDTAQSAKILTLESQTQLMSASLETVKHIEKGSVTPSTSGTTIHFQKQYDRPPIVFLTMRHIDVYMRDSGQTNPDFSFSLMSVDRLGFKVRKYFHSSASSANLYLEWISFPQ
jgi:hypothetical protein